MRHTGVKALATAKTAATISSIMLDLLILPEKFNFIVMICYRPVIAFGVYNTLPNNEDRPF